MGDEQRICPNCGHVLDGTHIQRQTVSQRAVELAWATCSRCRHVALLAWKWLEHTGEDPATLQQSE